MASPPSREFMYAYGSSYLAVGILGMIINLAEIVCIIKKTSKRKTFEKTVLSLSIADTVSGIFFILIGIGVILFTCELSNLRLVQCAVVGLNFSVMASLNHVLLIAIQRAFNAVIPKKLPMAQTGCFVASVLIFLWVSACIYGILSVLIISDFITLNSYVIIAYSLLAMLLFGTVLCKTEQECLTVQEDESSEALARSRRVMVQSVILTIGMFACYCPFAVNNLLLKKDIITGSICDILVAINPIVDAAAYFYANRRKQGKMGLQEANKELHMATEGMLANAECEM